MQYVRIPVCGLEGVGIRVSDSVTQESGFWNRGVFLSAG